jgi:hypothetical protein
MTTKQHAPSNPSLFTAAQLTLSSHRFEDHEEEGGDEEDEQLEPSLRLSSLSISGSPSQWYRESEPYVIQVRCGRRLQIEVVDDLERIGVFPALITAKNYNGPWFLHFYTHAELLAAMARIPAHFGPRKVNKASFGCLCGRLFKSAEGRALHD